MPDDDERSPLTRLRETARTGADSIRHAAEEARRRDDVVGGAVRAGAAGTGAIRKGVTALGRKADQGVARAAKNLTLGDYRAEVDAALMEATEVIAAQAVRIAALEERLRQLDAGQGESALPPGAAEDPTGSTEDGRG